MEITEEHLKEKLSRIIIHPASILPIRSARREYETDIRYGFHPKLGKNNQLLILVFVKKQKILIVTDYGGRIKLDGLRR